MKKKIVLAILASMMVLAVGCKEKAPSEDVVPSETPNAEDPAEENDETQVTEDGVEGDKQEIGKYAMPSKEGYATFFEAVDFEEIADMPEGEFGFTHTDENNMTTTFKFNHKSDMMMEDIINALEQEYMETEMGFFHTEVRTDSNGFYYAAPTFNEEDIFKADIVVDSMHIVIEGNYTLIHEVVTNLGLPSEEIPVDIQVDEEAEPVEEDSTEDADTAPETEEPVEDADTEDSNDN